MKWGLLTKEKFYQITRRDGFERVWDSFQGAIRTKIPIKINCVPIQGINEDEIPQIAALAREYPVNVRFIEMMPIGLGTEYTGILQEKIREALEMQYGTMVHVKERLGNGPAKYYKLSGFLGKIGFISAVSHKFCEECNRVRLTADGILKPCLNYESHTDLKKRIRQGVSDVELERIFLEGIYKNPKCHLFGNVENQKKKERNQMFEIRG